MIWYCLGGLNIIRLLQYLLGFNQTKYCRKYYFFFKNNIGSSGAIESASHPQSQILVPFWCSFLTFTPVTFMWESYPPPPPPGFCSQATSPLWPLHLDPSLNFQRLDGNCEPLLVLLSCGGQETTFSCRFP